MELGPDDLMKAGQVIVSAVVGFAGGLVAGERQDKRSLRSLEATLFAAASLRRVCENLVASANALPNWSPMIAGAYVDERGIDVIRGVLEHVRAVDLPETVSIDVLAKINLMLTQTENVLQRAQKGGHGTFITDLQDKVDELDPIIATLEKEMELLERFWLLKMVSKLNPTNWFKRDKAS